MKPRAIHQMLPTLTAHDAIGQHVIELQNLFRGWGYDSEIYAERWHPQLAQACRPYQSYSSVSHPDNLVLLHYSIGGDINHFARQLPDRLVLDYHNITPASYFYPYNCELALQLDEARRELGSFAGRAPAIADSEYNGRELESLQFRLLGVVNPIFALHQSEAHADPGTTASLVQRYGRAGSVHWLHVGRLAPNKCIHDIIKAFHYYHRWINPASRLLLVGSSAGLETYVDELFALVTRLELDGAVAFCGSVNQAADFYALADVYVAMSEHEGFCIPLVEAMQHGVPVVAFASTAVPETLGGAGVLIRKKDFPVIAELAHEVVTNAGFRRSLIAGQRARYGRFSLETAQQTLRASLEGAAEA